MAGVPSPSFSPALIDAGPEARDEVGVVSRSAAAFALSGP